MKNKKLLITGLVAIILIIICSITFILLNKKNDNNMTKESSIDEAILEYFNDTKSTQTSILALLENGYIEESEKDKCQIYELNGNLPEEKNIDCELALSIAKKPIIVIETTNNFRINEWNNVDSIISFKLKNNGNSYFKMQDIKSISWISSSGNIDSKEDKIIFNKRNYNDTITLLVEFDDLTIDYSFDIKIDIDIPKLIDKSLEDGIYAEYSTYSLIKDVYYGITKDNTSPKKEDMTTNNDFKYECNNEYNVWSYAVDNAGNESNVDYLGIYKYECETGSVIIGGK